MLAVLIAHTLVLSLWLTDEKAIQKQANFKTEGQTERLIDRQVLNVRFSNDSAKTVQPIFNITMGSYLK